MDDHHHCNFCFLSFCDFQESPCPVVPCPNCDTRLHKCKLSEHTACICPDSPVPCINQQYGCDQVLRRSRLGAHLESCPASSVLCRFVRQRWQLDYNWSQSAHHDLLLADEKLLQQDIKIMMDEKSIAAEPPEIISREGGNKPFDAEKTSLWCTVGSEYFIGPEKFSKVLTNTYRLTLSDYHLSQSYIYYRKDSSKLCHSFFCGAILRRDQFQSHAFNHQSLEVDFLSMRIMRCPLLSLGCCFGVQTYEPSRGGHIDYSAFMSCFTVSYKVSDKLQNAEYSATIERLPVELLYNIIGYLDSLSLWNLSQVNRIFRDLCETFLNVKGVIYFRWEKNIDDRWHQTRKRWTFPRTISPVISWEPVSPVATINEHLIHCPYNIKKIKTDNYQLLRLQIKNK